MRANLHSFLFDFIFLTFPCIIIMMNSISISSFVKWSSLSTQMSHSPIASFTAVLKALCFPWFSCQIYFSRYGSFCFIHTAASLLVSSVYPSSTMIHSKSVHTWASILFFNTDNNSALLNVGVNIEIICFSP